MDNSLELYCAAIAEEVDEVNYVDMTAEPTVITSFNPFADFWAVLDVAAYHLTDPGVMFGLGIMLATAVIFPFLKEAAH